MGRSKLAGWCGQGVRVEGTGTAGSQEEVYSVDIRWVCQWKCINMF